MDVTKIFGYSVPKVAYTRQEPDATGQLVDVQYFRPDIPIGMPVLMFDLPNEYIVVSEYDLTQYGLVLDATHIQITRSNFRTFINGRKQGMFERIRDEWQLRSR